MVHGKNCIPYRIDRRLTGLAGPDNDAIISFGLPIEPEDSQYGKYRITMLSCGQTAFWEVTLSGRRRKGGESCWICEREYGMAS